MRISAVGPCRPSPGAPRKAEPGRVKPSASHAQGAPATRKENEGNGAARGVARARARAQVTIHPPRDRKGARSAGAGGGVRGRLGMALRRLDVVPGEYFPAYVVWELTLRCDQPCRHCGSRAGAARPVEARHRGGAGRGAAARGDGRARGGAHRRRGLPARRLSGDHRGAQGRGRAADHDHRGARDHRGDRGADEGGAACTASRSASTGWSAPTTSSARPRAATGARSRRSGTSGARALLTAANTNLNRVNQGDLEALYELLREQGITAWQVQITAALGRAADRPAMLLQPYDLLDVLPRIAALKRRGLPGRDHA